MKNRPSTDVPGHRCFARLRAGIAALSPPFA